jgi:hypothetical protein
MGRKLAFAVVLVVLTTPSSASACSCAEDGEPDTLRGVDAAVAARLIDVEREEPGDINNHHATFTYRILRVYKGSGRYNLREGRKLTLENSTSGTECGLPANEGKRYGLMLDKFRGELNTSSCGVRGPREIRRAAERSGNARSSASGCASAS